MSSFFFWTPFIVIHALLPSCLVKCLGQAQDSSQGDSDSAIHSVRITSFDGWFGSQVVSDPNNSDSSNDLYLPNNVAIFISSNETILSDGACHLFNKFVCSSPDCYEDFSSTYSHQSPKFSTNDATRLNLNSRTISIAGGAWQINSPPLYLHSCDTSVLKHYSASLFGQIGLGLSGKAFQNFQAVNPIFSIVFHKNLLAELIFGFNSTYVNDSAIAISLPCDLDWKMPVSSVMVGNSASVSSPATLIFDLETLSVSLPQAHFTSVRNYFFSISKPGECLDQTWSDVSFLCFRFDSLEDLPPLIISLESGTRFVLPPEAYTIASSDGVRLISYTVRFVLSNSIFSGMEYIILGRTVLFNHYTVFEKLNNQTPTITLYPVIHNILDSNLQLQRKSKLAEVVTGSNSSNQANSSINTSSDITLSSNPAETQNTSTVSTNTDIPESIDPKIDQVENISESPNEDNLGESDNSLSVIIIIVLIVMICGFVVYVYLKKRQVLTHDKMVKEHRSSVELNGSSYFVSSNNINVHANLEISESE